MAASAWLVAAALRLRSTLDFLLAAYLVWAAGVIGLVLVLSPFEGVTRWRVLLASLALLGAAGAAWHARGRPRPPSFRPAVGRARGVLRSPPLAVLAVAVGCGLAYAAALAIGTPSNDYDVLWYHLPRAAIWYQQHGVGYIEHASTTHLNTNPPGAEILSTWAMTLEGSDRYAGVFQLLALVATMVGIARIARVLGLEDRAAIFAALLYASLPVVALQATTAGNDVVMASFLVPVVPFLLTDTRTALALGALALTLGVVTKGTVLFAVPVLIAVAAVLVPPRRWPSLVLAGAISIAVGGFWYVFNHLEAGSLTPGYEENTLLDRGKDPLVVFSASVRLAIDAVDPAGSVGRDGWLYAVAAAALLAVVGVAALRARSRATAIAGAGAVALVLVPLVFPAAYRTLLRAYQHVLVGRGEDQLAFLGWSREELVPTAFTSWFGAVGFLSFVVAVPLVVREIRRGALRPGALVLTLAPVLTLVVVAVTWGYSPWHGRFFMFAVALSAATWGIHARFRPLLWGLSAIATVTLVLSFVHYREKPAGFSVLEGRTPRAVWTASRVEILTSWAPALTAEGRVIEHLDREMEDGETVALSIRGDNVSYPYFGADLDRRVVFVGPGGEGLTPDVDWLVVAPERDAGVCAAGWREVNAGGDGWRVYRRAGLCPGESADS